ncbi:D-glycerate dehydrogenase [Elioraea sp. Yellowstone]|jgi:lactate dehydrogenase-like 2-hydroxyacid dehydrogenase|uniref:2-hydroxyacid dehydrogenase n=1 Tax=Elioraea sp. Yellowstone TaxID=2592070 RepID=UPI001154A13D|nr:D-glycerate dehydrogenase [Elioraea sp. Yellowstone]TQF79251.1 D-glycerate dehydrogenase [Elioraea sp. Yellowstone]
MSPAGKPALLPTRAFPRDVMARARRDYTVLAENAEDRVLAAEELLRRAAGAEAILCAAGDPLHAGTIARLPASLRAIATFSAGLDHIDLAAARARGIVVTNTPDVLTEATAELTMLLILAAARRAGEGERLVRSGQWQGWAPTQLLGMQVSGKRLGILGMGRIGRAVARMARGFRMAVHYHNRNRLDPALEDGATYHGDPASMLAAIDILALTAPGGESLRGWLNAERIALLRPGAVVVNSGRGSLVDDAALIAALKTGHVAFAGLDVYDNEPRLHPGYLDCPNAVLLPHLGSATVEARNAMGFRALDNLDAVFAGREPPDRVA